MPSERLPLLAMAFEPGREIPLGAAYIEIDTLSEEKPTELAHGNMPGFGQIEHRYINSAIQLYDDFLSGNLL